VAHVNGEIAAALRRSFDAFVDACFASGR